jgi:UDP-N-acetylglucosamine:LPS N-acetylglucosamine transferase
VSADAATARAPRVLVVSASIGEGHDLPARVLVDDLLARRPDAQARIVDALEVAGPLVKQLVMGGSAFESRWGNRVFDVAYALITRVAPARRLVSWLGERLAGGGMGRVIAAARPDVIVSTYPGATEVLGRLRARGELKVPLVSAITDLAALRYWAHPGVDVHLITHPESAEEVRAVAGQRTRVIAVRGLNDPRFATPPTREEGRRALGLPDEGKVVVVSGGGWGIGDLEGAIAAALAHEDVARVVVMCGRNEERRARLEQDFGERHERVVLLGFTDQVPELFAAADALVHSTAGLTVLEAWVLGCPTISYGWGRGHIRANNRAYMRYGIADVARDRGQLASALRRALVARRSPDAGFARLPVAADVVLDLIGDGAAGGGGVALGDEHVGDRG